MRIQVLTLHSRMQISLLGWTVTEPKNRSQYLLRTALWVGFCTLALAHSPCTNKLWSFFVRADLQIDHGVLDACLGLSNGLRLFTYGAVISWLLWHNRDTCENRLAWIMPGFCLVASVVIDVWLENLEIDYQVVFLLSEVSEVLNGGLFVLVLGLYRMFHFGEISNQLCAEEKRRVRPTILGLILATMVVALGFATRRFTLEVFGSYNLDVSPFRYLYSLLVSAAIAIVIMGTGYVASNLKSTRSVLIAAITFLASWGTIALGHFMTFETLDWLSQGVSVAVLIVGHLAFCGIHRMVGYRVL